MYCREVVEVVEKKKRFRGCSGRDPRPDKCISPSPPLPHLAPAAPFAVPPPPTAARSPLLLPPLLRPSPPPRQNISFPAMKPVGSLSLGRKLPSAGSLLVGILVGLLVASVCLL